MCYIFLLLCNEPSRLGCDFRLIKFSSVLAKTFFSLRNRLGWIIRNQHSLLGSDYVGISSGSTVLVHLHAARNRERYARYVFGAGEVWATPIGISCWVCVSKSTGAELLALFLGTK